MRGKKRMVIPWRVGWLTYLFIESVRSSRVAVGVGSDSLNRLLVGSVGGTLDHVEGVALLDSYEFRTKRKK